MTAAEFYDARKSGVGEGMVVDENLRANRKSLIHKHVSYFSLNIWSQY